MANENVASLLLQALQLMQSPTPTESDSAKKTLAADEHKQLFRSKRKSVTAESIRNSSMIFTMVTLHAIFIVANVE